VRLLRRLGMLACSLLLHRRAESDLHAELEDHLDQEIENNIRAGMTQEEARYAAQRLVGSVALFKEECRDQRGTAFFEDFARDLRYGARFR